MFMHKEWSSTRNVYLLAHLTFISVKFKDPRSPKNCVNARRFGEFEFILCLAIFALFVVLFYFILILIVRNL